MLYIFFSECQTLTLATPDSITPFQSGWRRYVKLKSERILTISSVSRRMLSSCLLNVTLNHNQQQSSSPPLPFSSLVPEAFRSSKNADTDNLIEIKYKVDEYNPDNDGRWIAVTKLNVRKLTMYEREMDVRWRLVIRVDSRALGRPEILWLRSKHSRYKLH